MAVTQLKIAGSFFAVISELVYAAFDLTDDVPDTFHVRCRGRELSFGVRLTAAVHYYACSLLQYLADALCIVADDITDLSLTDDGVTLDTDARIHDQFTYVAHTAMAVVYEIFTLT